MTGGRSLRIAGAALELAVGAIFVVSAVDAFLTGPIPPATSCGAGCTPAPVLLTWIPPELSLLVLGIAFLGVGTVDLVHVVRPRRAAAFDPGRVSPARSPLRPAALGFFGAAAALVTTVVPATEAAIPNGAGPPLIVGSLVLSAVGASIVEKELLGRS